MEERSQTPSQTHASIGLTETEIHALAEFSFINAEADEAFT